MFSSPIILYDYPQIAPESAGDLFDGTEIDEILTLRVSDAHRREKRGSWRLAMTGSAVSWSATEYLPPEALAKLHGAIRSLRSASKLNFREGDRVRLHPRKKADIFDIALDGKVAIVESVERDFENNVHLAVTVEDDPAATSASPSDWPPFLFWARRSGIAMKFLSPVLATFFKDDDIGCEVAKVLANRLGSQDVRLVDFGIRGLDLTFLLLEAPELTILVDVFARWVSRVHSILSSRT